MANRWRSMSAIATTATQFMAKPIPLLSTLRLQLLSPCGEIGAFTLKTTPRTKCSRCGTYIYAEVRGYALRGLNGDLLPEGQFKPEFPVHCRYVAAGIEDDLPHYKDTPVKFRGSGELMQW